MEDKRKLHSHISGIVSACSVMHAGVLDIDLFNRFILLLFVGAALLWYFSLPGGAAGLFRTYTSPIDQSVQSYGLYIPVTYANFSTHPVIFTGHGFGRSITPSASFSSTRMQFADTYGYLLVNLYGRGNTFYDGLGENDLFQVLSALHNDFSIDEDRIFFEGPSMGATGAFRQGLRHPDIFAAVGGADGFTDFREWVRQYYAPAWDRTYIEPFRLPNLLMDSCVDVAESAKWLDLYLIVDTGDTNVWPANTLNFDARLNELGSATPEAKDYLHTTTIFNAGHTANYNQSLLYRFFQTKSRIANPRHIVIKTTRLKYGRQYWASIDRLHTSNSFATLDARISNQAVIVNAENVRQFTLSLSIELLDGASSVTVVTNGSVSYTGPATTVSLFADSDGETPTFGTTPLASGTRRKTATLEGPIGDAFTTPFTVVYGTVGTPSENVQSRVEADTFCSYWNTWMHASITPVADTSVQQDANLLAEKSLIIFGTRECNAILKSVQPVLPIVVSTDGIGIGTRYYAGSNYGAYFVYPSPYAPYRYLVISHNTIPGSNEKDLEALPWYWPDYVIFDSARPAGICIQNSLAYLPDTFVEAGYFDDTWTLRRPDLLIGLDTVSPSGDDVYDDRGVQALSVRTDASGTATWYCIVQNDGDATDTCLLTGPAGDGGSSIKYFDAKDNTDLTSAITSSTGWQVQLASGSSRLLRVVVTPVDATSINVRMKVFSAADAVAMDQVQATIVPGPTLTLLAAPVSPTVGQAITLSASSHGFTTPEYAFLVDGCLVRIFSSDSSCIWSPAESGTYSVQIKARDTANASTELISLPFIIQVGAPPLSRVELVADPSNIPLAGREQLYQILPYGGNSPEYAFSVQLKDISPDGTYSLVTIHRDTEYLPSASRSFPPPEPGTYLVTVRAREKGATGLSCSNSVRTIIKSTTLTELSDFTASISSGIALDALPINGIKLAASVSGTGQGVEFYFTGTLRDVDADGSVIQRSATLSTAWGGPACFWRPSEPGYYTLQVTARDASCNYSCSRSMTFLVRSPSLKRLTMYTNPQSGVALNMLINGSIQITAKPGGSGTDVEYFFTGTRKETGTDGSITTIPVVMSTRWGTDRTFTWTPAEPGNYTLSVAARDATCNTSISTASSFVLHQARLSGVAGLTADIPSGIQQNAIPSGGITFSTDAIPTSASLQYYYTAIRRSYRPDGSFTDAAVTMSTVWSANPTFAWHPKRSGMHIIIVTARDTIFHISKSLSINYLIRPLSLTGVEDIATSLPSGIVLDAITEKGIVLTAQPNGSGNGAWYFFSAKLKDVQPDGQIIQQACPLSPDWSQQPTMCWKPGAPGLYTVTVAARDADCAVTFTRNIVFLVKSPSLTGITAFGTDIPSGAIFSTIPGDGVIFTTTVGGTGTGVEYCYLPGKSDGVVYQYGAATAWSANPFFVFHPIDRGKYRIQVYARDGSCNTSYSTICNYEVR